MPFGFSKDMIDLRAIIPIVIMFIVTAVETVGDTSAITEGGLGREATDKELSGSVICDGLGSSIASFFGVLPNTCLLYTSFPVPLVNINRMKIIQFFISTDCIHIS